MAMAGAAHVIAIHTKIGANHLRQDLHSIFDTILITFFFLYLKDCTM
jgi:hypothetical protein